MVSHYFQMGGWMMYVLMLVLLVALPCSVALPVAGYAIGKPKLAFLFSMILAVLGLAAAGAGALGRAMGMRMVEQAVAAVSPDMRDTILLVGSGESRVPLAFGLAIAALPLAAACLTLGRAFGERVTKAGTAGGLVMGLGTTIALGALSARQFSLVSMETAMGSVSAEFKTAILAAGANAAATYLAVALIGGLPLIVLGAVLLGLGARSARPQAAVA